MLFLGMMLGNVILLDLFNTLGLPTSTTVSMVFGLLGAAVAAALYRIGTDAEFRVGRPAAVHQLGQGNGHHRGDPVVGRACFRGRHRVHVPLAPAVLVPLCPGVPPPGSRVVRYFACGHPLFRAFQGAQELGPDRTRTQRTGIAACISDPPGAVGRLIRRAVGASTPAGRYHAGDDPRGYVRPGARVRGQRPGQFHRRAAGGMGFLAARGRSRHHVAHDGGADASGARQPADPLRCGCGYGAHALLFPQSDARGSDRAAARLAARGRGAVRLDGPLAFAGAGDPRGEPLVGAPHPRPSAGGHRPPFRAPARRAAQHGLLRYDPCGGESDGGIGADLGGHLL